MKLKNVFHLLLTVLVTFFGQLAHAQTFSVIHNFTGGGDGWLPVAGVTIRGGDLYGTTSAGGTFAGVVYQAKRLGANWSLFPISYVSISGNCAG